MLPNAAPLGLSEGEFIAVIGLLGTIAGALIAGYYTIQKIRVEQQDQRSEVAEIKTATTVNHHSSETPTLVDRLDTMQNTQDNIVVLIAGLSATVEAHHKEQERRNDQQDAKLAAGMVRFSQIETRIDRYHGKEG